MRAMTVAPEPGIVGWAAGPGTPVLSIVSPTYNERDNIAPLFDAIDAVFPDGGFELVVVDDDSPDGTALAVRDLARTGRPIRALRRVGRRGLSSAVVEGVLSCHAPFVAVIDADMQHDERLLPRMLDILRDGDADLVIGSRYADGGGVGDWSGRRRLMSRVATRCAAALIGTAVTDPMSGFFAIRTAAFDAAVADLSQQGFKILLDVIASSPAPLRIVELPYVFRDRRAGTSKLDAGVLAEFLFLLVEKTTRGLVPPRFVLFSLVGGLGVAVHLGVLGILREARVGFLAAQVAATLAAMTSNYVFNNAVTYRNQRLTGRAFAGGYVLFCVICTFGAIANISVADTAIQAFRSWTLAGIAGAAMSAVFNFGVATQLVWRVRRRGATPPS